MTVSISVLHSVFSVITTVTNIIVLVAIWRTPFLQSSSTVLLSGLAVADLGVGLVVQPAFTVLHVLIITKHFDVCFLVMFYNVSSSFLSGISVATVTALSLDRYLCLHLNLRYQEIVTKRRAKAALILIWISFAFLTSIWLKSFQAFLIAACVFLSICFFLICFVYIKIFRLVQHHKTQIQAQMYGQQNMADHIRTAVHTFVLVIVFSLCSAPLLGPHDYYTGSWTKQSTLVGSRLWCVFASNKFILKSYFILLAQQKHSQGSDESSASYLAVL